MAESATITKEFCEQYVSLLPRPLKYATEMHIVNVVIHGKEPHFDWFDDKSILELSRHNRVFPQIYAFIRDNKHIWIDNPIESV